MVGILKSKTKRGWSGAAIFLVFLWAAGCTSESSPPAPPAQESKELPDQQGWNSTVTATTKGRLAAVIRYGHMKRYSKRLVTEFDQGIEVDFFNAKGQHTSKLKADGGRFKESDDQVEVMGHVRVVSDSGVVLRTSRLRWDRRAEKIVTDQFVTITTADGDTLFGRGFESDLNLTHWEIRKPWGVSHRRIMLEPVRKHTVEDTAAVGSGPAAVRQKGLGKEPDSAAVAKKAPAHPGTASKPRRQLR